MRVRWLVLGLLLPMILTACGKKDPAPAAQVRIDHFRVSDAIPLDGGRILEWKTRGASALQLLAGDETISLEGEPVGEGTVHVVPEATTTYTLVATGPGGRAEAQATVHVSAERPRVVLRIEPDAIDAGGAARLLWEVEHADSMVLETESGEVLASDTWEGTLGVEPARTTAYRLTARGPGGEERQERILGVRPVIDRLEGPTTSVHEEMEVEIAWTTRGATQVVLRSEDGFVHETTEARGTVRAPVGPAGKFTLRATSGDLSTEKDLQLELVRQPLIHVFTATPTTATEDSPGETTITWEVYGADEIVLDGEPLGEPQWVERAGSLQVPITKDTSFRLTATNEKGSVSRLIEARAIPPPSVVFFDAMPSVVQVGQLVMLDWEVEHGATVEIWEVGGERLSVDPGKVVGSFSHPVTQDTGFRLVATNELGAEAEAFTEVGVGSFLVVSVTAPERVAPGAAVEISWVTQAAVEAEVKLGGETVCATTDLRQVQMGSCTFDAPETLGTHRWEFTARNVSATSMGKGGLFLVGDGPIIRTLQASKARASVGEVVRFSYQVDPDVYGNPAELELVDPDGGSMPLDLGAGFVDVVLVAPGVRTYTLRASTSQAQEIHERSVDVEVHELPQILSFSSNPPFVSESTESIDLQWETAHATKLTIHQVQGAGVVVPPLLSEQDLARIASGTLTIPWKPDLRLTVENPAGAMASVDLWVGLNPAEILSFDATPNPIERGGSTTLSWETDRALALAIEFDPWVETDDPYVDISQSPTAVALPVLTSAYDGRLFSFPDGFTFPFEGSPRSEAVAMGHGFLSFDGTKHGANASNAINRALPNDAAPAHLAPFWGDMNIASKGAEIWYELRTEGGRRHLVIQFGKFSHADHPDAMLNFQVVLWEDGAFDYRYGEMNSADPDVAAGSLSTVAFQGMGRDVGQTLLHRQAFPGGLSWRSFHFPVLPFVLEATPAPAYVDISGFAGAQQLHPPSASGSMATLDPMPDGFTFSFRGAERTALQVGTGGWITFTTTNTSGFSTVGRLAHGAPPLSSSAVPHLAPFWAPLNRGSTGEIWVATTSDADGPALVVQWKGYAFTGATGSGSQPTSSLDFQVWLREDGSFEYRYGTMSHSADASIADGSTASIGFQSEFGTWGLQLSYLTPWAGGLSDRSFRFEPALRLPATGSLEVAPRGTVEYTLVAADTLQTAAESVEVVVHAPQWVRSWIVPAFPTPHEPMALHWDASGLTGLQIEDEDGLVLHTAGPSELAGGRLDFPAGLDAGLYTFSFVATGPMGQFVEEQTALVAGNFEIVSFGGDETIVPGEAATLSWVVEGATSVVIETLDGIDVGGAGLDPETGSVQLLPQANTTYVLRAESLGRDLSASWHVTVRTVRLEGLQASAREIPLGGSTTLNWTATGAEATLSKLMMLEGGAAFDDISLSGATTLSNSGFPVIPLPFAFPFFGETYTSLKAAKGFLSLGGTESSAPSTVQAFPTSNSTNNRPRIAPFWHGSLGAPTGAVAHWKHVPGQGGAPDALIIQWKGFRAGSLTGSIVNFQVALFADGAIEFRYGEMTGTTDAHQNRADGSESSIGFQNASGSEGFELLFRSPMYGGLSHRSFRFQPTFSSPSVVVPLQTDDFEFCVEDDNHRECETIRIVVVRPGDLAVTEVMLDPLAQQGQWFELRNLAPDPINLDGKVLQAGATTHTLSFGGPRYLGTGEYAIFAEYPDVPPGAIAWGSQLSLGAPGQAGNVALRFGNLAVAEFTWDAAAVWTPGVSRELRSLLHKRGTPTRAMADTCQGTELYDGMNAGSPGAAGAACTDFSYMIELLADAPFLDIRSVGTRLQDVSNHWTKQGVPGDLGFAFPFFGTTLPASTPVWVISKGYLTFTDIEKPATGGDPWGVSGTFDSPKSFGTFQGPAGGSVAPFWTKMRAVPGAQAHFHRDVLDGREVLIVQWSDWAHYDVGGLYTLQVQLYDDGEVVFAYGDLDGPPELFGLKGYGGMQAPGPGGFVEVFGNQAILIPHTSTRLRVK